MQEDGKREKVNKQQQQQHSNNNNNNNEQWSCIMNKYEPVTN